jgi:hypothetical protein
LTVTDFPLKIRTAGSSTVHVAYRVGTAARTPCGFSPVAGAYTVVPTGVVDCARCLDAVVEPQEGVVQEPDVAIG